MKLLVKRLGHVNVHPYYVYVHDLVQGVEDLRTTLQTALDIEKHVRGSTAGFNTPTFVVDAPGGGGKRDAHSFEHYDRTTGISVYTAPSVKPGITSCTSIRSTRCRPRRRRAGADPSEQQAMVDDAINEAQPQKALIALVRPAADCARSTRLLSHPMMRSLIVLACVVGGGGAGARRAALAAGQLPRARGRRARRGRRPERRRSCIGRCARPASTSRCTRPTASTTGTAGAQHYLEQRAAEARLSVPGLTIAVGEELTVADGPNYARHTTVLGRPAPGNMNH